MLKKKTFWVHSLYAVNIFRVFVTLLLLTLKKSSAVKASMMRVIQLRD